MKTVWVLTIEAAFDTDGSVVAVFGEKPTAEKIANLTNICIDDETAEKIVNELHVEDEGISNYFYHLEEEDVL